MSGRRLLTPEDVLTFMRAGNATFTIVSRVTGTRFTYRARKSEDGNCFFVSLLRGPDNGEDYTYMGIMDGRRFRLTAKSKVTIEAPAYKAFLWLFNQVVIMNALPDTVEVWHEGRCGRCNRLLTVPESIASGIGPECARHVHRMPGQLALAV